MHKYIWLMLLVIVLAVNIFFRLGPAFLPFTETMARNSVTDRLVKDAQKQIDEKFKDLPAPAKFKATQDIVNIWKKEGKKAINEAIKKKQKEFKSNWQDESAQTFLLEIDSYHWFRLINNLVTNGRIGDKVLGNSQYDSFMLAPIGMRLEPSLHKNLQVYLNYYIFKIVKIFRKNISPMHFVFYIPIFISSLVLILAFFFCLNISKNNINISSFFAAMTLGLAPIFLNRSLAGWFDTDQYVVLFSLLSAWTFYLSLKYDLSVRMRLLFAATSGLSIGLFSFTWDGWWYIFDLMILAALLYILNIYLAKKDTEELNLDVPFISLSLFILSSVIFVGLFSGLAILKNCLTGIVNIAFAKGYLQNQFWPNTFLTVDELRMVGLSEVIRSIGGCLVVSLALFYLVIAVFDKRYKDYKYRKFIFFLFSLWILIMSYVSIKARRFGLLLGVPVSISFGLFLGWALDFLSNTANRLIKIPRIKEILLAIFCGSFIFIFSGNAFLSRNAIPLMNKSWWNILNKIRIQTPGEAIINSWWDYGHWFKAIAQRRVIFDGATQNTAMAYWMGRAFLSDNEAEAVGILRMLNSGSNKAFEELEKLGIDKYKCLEILNEIILLKYKDADAALSKYIWQKEDREKVLEYTHSPQAAYFIVEPSLLFKMRMISFLGGWDFKKASIYQKFRESKKARFIEYITKVYKYKRDDALLLYDTLLFLNTEDALSWISPEYNNCFFSESKTFRKEDNLLLFDNGFIVNLDNRHVYFNDTKKGKWGIPKSIFYIEDDTLKRFDLEKGNLEFSVLLIRNKDDYKIIAVNDKLANSMFTRLYYLNGIGLKYFKPFITEELKNDEGHIIVYKIEWDAE